MTAVGNGSFRFYRGGRGFPVHVNPGDYRTTDVPVEDDHTADHTAVDPAAATTRWDGTELQRGHAVAVIAQWLTLPTGERRVTA